MKKPDGYVHDWRFRVETNGKVYCLHEFHFEILPAISIYRIEGFVKISVSWLIWSLALMWEDMNVLPF